MWYALVANYFGFSWNRFKLLKCATTMFTLGIHHIVATLKPMVTKSDIFCSYCEKGGGGVNVCTIQSHSAFQHRCHKQKLGKGHQRGSPAYICVQSLSNMLCIQRAINVITFNGAPYTSQWNHIIWRILKVQKAPTTHRKHFICEWGATGTLYVLSNIHESS